ncbi:MAG TPA: aminoacyl-histidine dipeptidase [Geobacter sp.]|nr:aminoacyl-histidine dipeptidase [Geobacter sp.]
MSEIIDGLTPALFWRCFAEISAIPRPSGHEEKIARFVLDRARELGLSARQDSCGNVVVKKPASHGKDGVRSICLQAHLDMVCEKNADKVHDFLREPIELVRRGGVLMANGTTLGADNGIGVATCLAIMEERSLQHGALEFLFTIEEETGLRGAKNLDPALVESTMLLNLDSEEEGALYVGCAGGRDTLGKWAASREEVPAGMSAVRLTLRGLKGGHSGLEIDKGLGNAIKLLNRAVLRLSEMGGRLSSIDGGNMRNAIPRECGALMYLPDGTLEKAEALVATLDATFREELACIDPEVALIISRQDVPGEGTVLDHTLQNRICKAIAALPSGVQHMSADILGLVETSTNVSVINTTETGIELVTSQRSSSPSRLDEVVETVRAILELSGASVEVSEGYPGWKPNLASPILNLAIQCYRKLYGKDPEVKAIHAGLECGIIGERIPGMDMISFGPTMEGVHSPDEKVYIDSVGNYWDFVLAVLKSAE